MMDKKQAMKVLRENGCSKQVINHAIMVSVKARSLAERIKNNGHKVSVELCEVGGLLHDVGRSRTHGVLHSLKGGRILKEHPMLARIAEVHLGGGLPRQEAKLLGFPDKDYMPVTLEEKIVCYADKLVHGNRYADNVGEEITKLRKKLGKSHPSIKRLEELEKEIRALL